jgi:hypothetical protein
LAIWGRRIVRARSGSTDYGTHRDTSGDAIPTCSPIIAAPTADDDVIAAADDDAIAAADVGW